MEVKEIEFAKLRHAYITVRAFLESEACAKIKSLNTRVAEDLSLFGDDNDELLEKFVTKFELDHRNFRYDKHFISEGELVNSGASLLNFLILSVWLPMKTIELLTFNNIKLPKPDFVSPRQVSDMTFKDLLTWYIEGEYKTAENVKYKIVSAGNDPEFLEE
jgi:hypothetical protein